MIKSEITKTLARRQTHIVFADIESAVKIILEHMINTLSNGERIEIRGFGSFDVHYRSPRIGRNPKSGKAVSVPAKFILHFKAGKGLREGVNKKSLSDS
ncbi:MAG: integration host factor subunit beta [Proteobacteria bacterium]|nr:integration host factor subunit beta [Pseudomonadota bacterium]